MALSETELNQVIQGVVDALKEPLTKEFSRQIETEIEGRFLGHIRSHVRRNEWCCDTMKKFALQVWNAPTPNKRELGDGLGSTRFMLRSFDVIYCPFCGVKL